MKHAGPTALEALDGLLKQIRKHAELAEKTPGIFYRGRTAFLHFHEDPNGLFADVKLGKEYRRYRVSTATEQQCALKIIEAELKKS